MTRGSKKPKVERKPQNIAQTQAALEIQQLDEQGLSPEVPEVEWSKIDTINANSLEARWEFEKWSVIRELWRAQYQMVTYYMKTEGGGHSFEEAIKMASTGLGEGPMLDEEIKRICSWDVDSISWYALNKVFCTNPSYAQEIWEEVKEQALNDFKSGHFAAEMFERTDLQKDVWKRAHFVVIYEEMIAAYKPRDAIEQSMMEMVAVHFFLWRHWVTEHLQRATTKPRRESEDYNQWRKDRKYSYMLANDIKNREFSGQYLDGAWDVPYQRDAEAIQHALEMADRCRRAYHASVRALRDWRRYGMPVTINNPHQVNIAADGGQQVNMQGKRRRERKTKKLENSAKKED